LALGVLLHISLLGYSLNSTTPQRGLACGSGAELGRVPLDSHSYLGDIPKKGTQSRFTSDHLLVAVLRQHGVSLIPGHQWPMMLPAGN